jgi:hypothetical protein
MRWEYFYDDAGQPLFVEARQPLTFPHRSGDARGA